MKHIDDVSLGILWFFLAQVALLASSNLLIIRNIEWENLMLGFEQVNHFSYYHLFLIHLDADFGAHVVTHIY